MIAEFWVSRSAQKGPFANFLFTYGALCFVEQFCWQLRKRSTIFLKKILRKTYRLQNSKNWLARESWEFEFTTSFEQLTFHMREKMQSGLRMSRNASKVTLLLLACSRLIFCQTVYWLTTFSCYSTSKTIWLKNSKFVGKKELRTIVKGYVLIISLSAGEIETQSGMWISRSEQNVLFDVCCLHVVDLYLLRTFNGLCEKTHC